MAPPVGVYIDTSRGYDFSVILGCMMSWVVRLLPEDYANVFEEAEGPPIFGKRIAISALPVIVSAVIVAAVEMVSCWSVEVVD